MKAHQRVFTCLILALLVTVMVAQNPQQPKEPPEADVSQFPILDYGNKPVLKNKNRKKYNNRDAPKLSESSDGIWTTIDWEVGLPALPVAKSAAVILGEVTQAQAQLSDDETNIYSEFTIQITDVLKNDNNLSVGAGNLVLVERLGGRLRFPSGKIVVSQTDHQDLPRVGKRYVLFLRKDEGEEDFNIITGYELRDGKVFPLDKPRRGHPITAYTGTSETSFLADLNKTLADSSTSQH